MSGVQQRSCLMPELVKKGGVDRTLMKDNWFKLACFRSGSRLIIDAALILSVPWSTVEGRSESDFENMMVCINCERQREPVERYCSLPTNAIGGRMPLSAVECRTVSQT